MSAKRIDGRAIASAIVARLKVQMAELGSPALRLISLYVGDDDASAVYIRNQQRACRKLGIEFELDHLPASAEREEVVRRIEQCNRDPTVTGVLLQRPLPRPLDHLELQSRIHPDKDVEGLHPANIGSIVYGVPRLVPCTALAAIRCLLSTGVPLKGADVVMIGHSEVVGKPIAFLMLNYFATCTICHVATQDLPAKTRSADVVFTAVGKHGLVTGDMVKPGSVVIDIGIQQVPMRDEHGEPVRDEQGQPRYRLAGDVEFESVQKVAGYLTPVPGGVGPVTVTMLLHNIVLAARKQAGLDDGPLGTLGVE